MKCKLTRLESNHQNLRTSEIIGDCDDAPAYGQIFSMSGEPINPDADVRLVWTTPVTEVKWFSDVKMEFWTKNSHYAWEKLEATSDAADVF